MEQTFCNICNEPWSDNHRQVSIQCGHYFGESCIRSRLDEQRREQLFEGLPVQSFCPECKQDTNPEDIQMIPTDCYCDHQVDDDQRCEDPLMHEIRKIWYEVYGMSS